MAVKIELTDDLERIARDLEEALKDIIEKEGLIDTGRLINSVRANVTDNQINIQTEDYYKYLDEKYKLTSQFEKSKAFDVAVKRLEDSIGKDIENSIE